MLLAQQETKKDISLEEIWASRTFAQEMVHGLRSMEDGLHYTALEQLDGEQVLNQYSYQTGKLAKKLLSATDLIPQGAATALQIDDYTFSADESKVLIATESELIYRHSSRSNYYVYDFKTKSLTRLSEGGKQLYATFSPKKEMVAFVRDNNIFVKDLKSGQENQVTKDGKQNAIINGATDWVYEEEFSFDKAFFWSPDGDKIAFYRFDENKVMEFSMSMYKGSLYPVEYRYKYPKAGEVNSIVSIHVHNISQNKNKKIDVGQEADQYIPRVQWANSNTLSIQRLNRLQNKMEILHCNVLVKIGGDLPANAIYTETSDTYIDGSDDKAFYIKDGKEFIWLSDKGGFNHIYLFGSNGKQLAQITNGKWDVTEYYGIDEKNGLIYFQSAEESPMERYIYSINLNGKNKKKLSQRKGWNKATFSKGFKSFINEQSDANTPLYISLHAANGKQIRELKDNAKLRNTLASYNLSKKAFFSFKTSEDVELNGWMIKPPNFDSSVKYPVFMTVYGGPGSQTVKDSYEGPNYLWHQMLAQKGYIVVSVDNRGTGARGAEFKKFTYLQLGKYETIDQIEAAKYLGALDYVDESRIGIQGWSYGGYMSSLCITKGADVFKTAIAVAPVTNWRFYDTIYTERYMRTPQENADGYDDNSPINHVAKLKGKYLIVHGTA
ncbi:MAG: S9 family peptidase, partial [Bacteroidetes bacterium]|nr:S9 family peptidase [Bacteroidota bacterium]